MNYLENISFGIYEKALPKDITWKQRLEMAKKLGFNFIEISIDETDKRLKRLDWTLEERKNFIKNVLEIGVKVPSMCFSGHRRFPLGSENKETREKSLELMEKAIKLASDLGIRNIQMAGYDVYYETSNEHTKKLYMEGMKKSLEIAEKYNVMLSIEIMDHPFINSITKYLEIADELNSPFLTVYPDIGNLSAWGNDIKEEIKKGKGKISAIHLKDTLAVTNDFPGKFKEVPFGEGCVDFKKFFEILNEINYKGPFLIEMWTEKSSSPLVEISDAKSFIENKMKEGGYIKC